MVMEEKQKSIIENYVNSYNQFDVSGMTNDLSDDVVFENISNGNVDLRTEGLQAFKEQAETAKQYFNQRKQVIESWDFKESCVSIRIDYTGTLAMDLPNGLKKGDTLKLKGESVFEFANSKIIRITDRV